MQVVQDVHEFPGHIACDSATNSEVVVPMKREDVVIGVLDIDSPKRNRFDEVDALWLEKITNLIVLSCDWNSVARYDVQK